MRFIGEGGEYSVHDGADMGVRVKRVEGGWVVSHMVPPVDTKVSCECTEVQVEGVFKTRNAAAASGFAAKRLAWGQSS